MHRVCRISFIVIRTCVAFIKATAFSCEAVTIPRLVWVENPPDGCNCTAACQTKHGFMKRTAAVCPTHTHTPASAGAACVYSVNEGGSWEAAIFSSGFITARSLARSLARRRVQLHPNEEPSGWRRGAGGGEAPTARMGERARLPDALASGAVTVDVTRRSCAAAAATVSSPSCHNSRSSVDVA